MLIYLPLNSVPSQPHFNSEKTGCLNVDVRLVTWSTAQHKIRNSNNFATPADAKNKLINVTSIKRDIKFDYK